MSSMRSIRELLRRPPACDPAIDSLADTPFFARQSIAFSNHFGRAEYSFDVVRNGRLKHIDAIATNPEPNLGPVGFAAFPIFGAAVFAFLICAIVATFVLLSNPSRLTWSFYLFCIGAMVPWFGSISIAQTVPMPFGFVIQIVRVTLLCVGSFCGARLRAALPDRKGGRMAKTAGLGGAFFGRSVRGVGVLGVVFCWDELFRDRSRQSGRCRRKSLYCRLLDCQRRRHVSFFGSHPRQRVKWAVIGISLGYSAIAGHDILFQLRPVRRKPPVRYVVLRVGRLPCPIVGSVRNRTSSRHRRALRSESRLRIFHSELDISGRDGVDVLDHQYLLTTGSRGGQSSSSRSPFCWVSSFYALTAGWSLESVVCFSGSITKHCNGFHPCPQA